MVRLGSAGWSPVAFDVGSMKVDLAMAHNGETLVVEAKTITGSGSGAVRAAFAQLAEYSWKYRDLNELTTSAIRSWAFFEFDPTLDEIRFLETGRVNSTTSTL
jgi:hypothetical protein